MIRLTTSFLILALAGTASFPAMASPASNSLSTFHRGGGRSDRAKTLFVARGGVAIGMTKKQVLQIMGQPTQKQGEFWTWLTHTSGYGVQFKNDKVIRCGVLQG